GVYVVALEAERARDRVANVFVVLDDQDPSAWLSVHRVMRTSVRARQSSVMRMAVSPTKTVPTPSTTRRLATDLVSVPALRPWMVAITNSTKLAVCTARQ